ncbi:MAG: hypothetical protein JWM39_839 [Parcubacteria group bacterium]|nr:hypothetical protein [Parcubacteria group bacterium]
MTLNLDQHLLSTKDASALSGYNADYLSRLCRSGKIAGTQIGRTWLVNSESLQQFVREQEERKQQISSELSQSREKEYQHAQKNTPARAEKKSKSTIGAVRSPFTTFVRTPAFAFALSILVMGTSVYAATFGPISSVMEHAGALTSAAQQTITGSTNTVAPRLRIASNVSAARTSTPATLAVNTKPLKPVIDGNAIATRLARIDAPNARDGDTYRLVAYDAAANNAAALHASRAQNERAFGRFIESDEPISARVADAGTALTSSTRDAYDTILNSYAFSLNRAGDASLAFAADMRDTVVRSPQLSTALLDTYSNSMYAWVDGSQMLTARTADAEVAAGPAALAIADDTQQNVHALALATQSAVDSQLDATHGAASLAMDFAPHAVGGVVALGDKIPSTIPVINAQSVLVPTNIVASAASFSPFDGTVFLTQGRQIAFAAYGAIHSFADSVRGAYAKTLAYMFGTKTQLAVVPLPPAITIPGYTIREPQNGQAPSDYTGYAYIGGTTTRITNIQNYFSTTGGVTKQMLDESIDAATLSLSGNSSGGGGTTVITGGGGFSGGALSATTGDFSSDVNVDGNFTLAGTLASAGEISAPFFTATSLAATSTLPNIISNSFSIGGDTITDFTGTGLAVVNGKLTATATTSNAFQQGGNIFGTTATLGTQDANPLAFITNNIARMTIDAAGNVTVGTTTSASLLTIGGDTRGDTFTAVGTGTSTLPRLATSALALGNDYVTGFTGNGLAVVGGVLGLAGSNNYFSTTSSDFWLGTKSTSDLAEGSKLYFTNARADARINATTTIGTLTSAPNLGTLSTTLTGIVKATSGVLSSAVAGTDYENPLAFVYPLQRTLNSISLAFGTTTANSWSQLQSFGNITAANATTTTLDATTLGLGNSYFTSLLGSGLQNVGGVLTLDRTGDWTGTFGGQIPSYYLDSANQTGVLAQANGGTGIGSFNPGDILYADNMGTLTTLPVGSTGQVLKIQAGLPQWGVDATVGAGGSDGIFATSSGLVYPLDTSNTLLVGTNATSTTNSIFEVHGQSYFSSKLSIATTTAPVALSVGGSGYFTGGLGVGILNTVAGTLRTSGAADIGGNLIVTGATTLASATSSSFFTSNFGIGSTYFSSLTGAGLLDTAGVLTLDTTGNWAGTFNGHASSFYLDATNLNNFGTPFYTFLHATTTDALAEGVSHLYFTDARADARINATSTIGTLTSAPNLGTVSTSLNGLLKATSGVLSVASAGTDFQAPITASYPVLFSGNNVSLAFSTTTTNSWSSLQTFGAGFVSQASSTVAGPLTVSGAFTIPSVTNALLSSNGSGVVGATTIGNGLAFSANTLSVSTSSLASGFFKQSGNAFGTTAVLGTTDSNALTFITSNTERARFDTSGNFGIGTSSPSQLLSVQGSGLFSGNISAANVTATGSLAVVGVTNTGNEQITGGLGVGVVNTTAGTIVTTGAITTGSQFIGLASDGVSAPSFTWATDITTGIYHAAGNTIGFTTAGVGRAVIDGNGNLGIGSTSPAAKLSVEGNALIHGTATIDGLGSGLVKSTNGLLGLAVAGTDYAAPFTATYPILFSANNLSLAFGTTTANSWSQLQQFNGAASSTQLTVTGNTYLATNAGSVGIGTSSPFTTLGVAGTVFASGNITTTGTLTATALGTHFAVASNNGTLTAPNAFVDTFLNDVSQQSVVTGFFGINTSTGGFYRTLTGTAGQITVANGSGAGGNPTFSLPTAITGVNSITAAASTNLTLASGGSSATSVLLTPNGGGVGIGTTSPSQLLSVQGNGLFSGNIAVANITATGTLATAGITDSGNAQITGGLGVGTVNTTAGTIVTTGAITTGSQFIGLASDAVNTPSFTWAGDLTTGIYHAAGNTIGFTTSGVERARIDGNGFLGLGSTTPSTRLSVEGNALIHGTVTVDGLGSGLVKSTNGTLGLAVAGTDYENPLTFNAPLSRTVNAISISQATVSTNGYLASADFNLFNNKVSSTSLSGASVISYTSGTGVITTTGGTFGGGNYVFPANTSVAGNLIANTIQRVLNTSTQNIGTTSTVVLGAGGTTNIVGGNASFSGAGGNVTLTGGTGIAAGGNIVINAGTGASTGSILLGSTAGFVGIATSTPGSLLSIGGVANFTAATSTLYGSGGINLSAGCFAINGACVGGNTLSFSYPLTLSGTNVSLAFGTTTANTWSALQTFNGGVSASTIITSGAITTGSQFIGLASDGASAPSFTWAGDLTTGIYHAAGNTIGFTTSGVERARIDGNGFLGLGSTTPSTRLSVEGNALIHGTATIDGLGSGLVKSTNGLLGLAVAGTDYLAPGSLSATYPILYSGNNFSLAFGTTTANSWSALQTFNGGASTTQLTSTGSTYLATTGGNVGVGTAAPAFKLDVAGPINTDIFSGYYQGGKLLAYASSTNDDTIFGLGSGGQNATTSAAIKSLTAFGFNALAANTTGNVNNAFGANALAANTTGGGNNAFGANTLTVNISGSLNDAFGNGVLIRNTTGSGNNAIGSGVLSNNTTGSNNNAIGSLTLVGNTTGSNNNAIGNLALNGNTGNSNSALGDQAGSVTTAGSQNLFLGAQSNTIGAGYISTGSNNIGIGYNTLFPSATASNQLNIGNFIYGTIAATSSASTFSAPGTGLLGIGSSTPGSLLSIGNTNGINFSTATSTFSSTGGINLTNGCYAVNGVCVGTNAGTVTSVDASGGTTGLTFSGGPVTTSGTLALAGTLVVANGGTGSTTLSGLLKGNGTGSLLTAIAGTDYLAPGSLSATYPILYSGNNFSLAFGTTTANSWSQLQTFTSGFVSQASSTITGVLNLGNNVNFNEAGTTTLKTPDQSSGNIGSILISTGAVSGVANPGNITIMPGNSPGSGGNVLIKGGSAGFGTPGNVTIQPGIGISAGYALLASNGGLVGIGATTTPSQLLSVQGNGLFSGNISAANLTATGTVTTANLTLAALNGPLQAINGVVSATTSIGVVYGGTGSTTLTGLLKGNGTGSLLSAVAGTDYQAPLTFVYPLLNSANTISLDFGTTTANTWSGLQTFGAGFVSQASSTVAGNFTATGFISTSGTTGGYQIDNQLFAYGSTTSGAVVLGFGAGGDALTTGTSPNVAIGNNALHINSGGTSNVAIGYQAMLVNQTGSSNTAIGSQALIFNQTGSSNTAIGQQALNSNTVGSNNVGIGANALQNNTTATNTVAIGVFAAGGSAAYTNQGGTYVGYSSGFSAHSSSDYNSFFGYQSGAQDTTGNDNIFIGAQPNFSGAGYVTTGANDIGLGFNTRFPSATASNQLNIGNFIYGTLPATTTASTFSVPTAGHLGIGSSSPYAKLSVHANNGSTDTTLFSIGSSTASLTTTLLSVSNTGVITSNAAATSTFTNGIALTGGCVSVNGACIGVGSAGTVTSVDAVGGTTGLTFSGGPITSSGVLTLAGTLGVANGGTGAVTLTGLVKGNGTGAFTAAVAGTDYQAPLAFTYPLVNTANTISLAFGTTTANTWSQLQQFNGGASTTQLTVTGSTYLATTGGNVGVGTAAPAFKLDVAGPINTNIFSGYYQGGQLLAYASSTNGATIFGLQAGGQNATTSASAISLTAIGFKALSANTTGFANTGVGFSSLISNTTGFDNTAFGISALGGTTIGSNNVAVGASALFGNVSGTNNVAVGINALGADISATTTVAVGSGAGWGSGNYSNQGGTYLGYQAGTFLANGSDYNTLLGYQSGSQVTSGYGNILVGPSVSSNNLTTGSGNIGIGYNLSFPAASTNNYLNIGSLIFGTLPATTTSLTAPVSGLLGIGTTSPYAKLSVQSNNGDTATTLFAIGSSTASLNSTLFSVSNTGVITSNAAATSTFTNGIALTGGCVSVNGTCLGTGSGGVTSVNAVGGTTGLTFSGGPITSSGTLTLAGTLGVANGGTGSTTLTGLLKGNGTGSLLTAVAGTDYLAPGSLSATYPILYSANNFSLAFGTTTANTWSSLQTFTSGLISQASSTFSGSLNVTGSSYFGANVGIGTTTAAQLLTLSAADTSTSLITAALASESIINSDTTNNNTADLVFKTADTAGATVVGTKLATVFTSHTPSGVSADLAFITRNAGTLSEKLRLTAAGNLGVGTTTPSQALSVQGNGLFSGNISSANVTATGTITTPNLTIAALNGPLQANNGVVSATTSIGVQYGGTGAITLTGLIKGNGTSAFTAAVAGTDYQAPLAFTYPLVNTTNTISLAFGTTTANSWNSLQQFNGGLTASTITTTGSVGIGTSTPGSLLSIGTTNGINFSTATSTFSSTGGINLTNGCYAVNGVCLSTGGGTFTNTLANGGTATTTFYAGGLVFSDGTKLTQASGSGASILSWNNTNGFLGIGSSSPSYALSVQGTSGIRVKTTTNTAAALGIENSQGTTTLQADTLDSSDSIFSVATSTGNTYFYVGAGGNVGVGTTTPLSALAIGGAGGLSVGADYNIAAPTNGAIIEGGLGVGTTSVMNNDALDVSGAVYINGTGTNPLALSVGATAAATPSFSVDQSAGIGTGLSVVTNLVGSGVTLQGLSSAANENFNILSKGGGNIKLFSNGGSIQVSTAFGSQYTFAATALTITGFTAAASGNHFSVVGGIDTAITAATESSDVYFNLGQTRTNLSNTAVSTFRDFRITGSTHAFATAGGVINNAAGFSVDLPDSAGTNATISTSSAIYVPGGAVTGTVSTSTAANLLASTGATNNFALTTNGRVVHSSLTAGAGAGSVCMSATGELLFDSGANCIVSTPLAKHNIHGISDAQADEVLSLDAIQYDYNDGSGTRYGFNALQAASIDPTLVVYAASDIQVVGADGNPVTVAKGQPYTFDYGRYTGLLTAEVQKQQKQISLLASTTLAAAASAGAPAPVAATTLSANSIYTQSLTIKGNAFATSFVAPATPITFTIGSTTGTLPNEVLASDGSGVDLYKAATYAITGVQALQAQTGVLASRLDAVELRVTMLEAEASSTQAVGSGTLSLAGFEDLLGQIGVIVKDGIAHFTSLAFTNLISAPAADGTSAVATSTIAMGDTQAVVVNNLAHPTSEIFVTITSPLNGSWYISQKGEGSFTINLSSPQTADVTFDYFIVQTEKGATQVASVASAPVQTPAQYPDQTPVDPSASTTPAASTNAPTITLTGSAAIDIAQGAPWTDPGAIAQDAAGKDLTAQIAVTGSVDTNTAGLYTLNYSVVDSAGASAGVSRIVHVSAPVVSSPPAETAPPADTSAPVQTPASDPATPAASAPSPVTADAGATPSTGG